MKRFIFLATLMVAVGGFATAALAVPPGKVARDTAGINRQERVRPDKNEGAVSRVLTTLTKRRQP